MNIEEQIKEIVKKHFIIAGIPSPEGIEELTNLLTQAQEEAVRGFVEYANDIATGTTAEVYLSSLAETYLQSLDGGKGEAR
jgi:hypothetical protein